jgi:ribonuclease Z
LLTLDPHQPKKYAYCSDTAYNPAMIPLIKGVDLLYHESTFLQQHAQLAAQTQHSTAQEAAKIARDAEVGKLILGHYSSRYKDLSKFKDEAQQFFAELILASDGMQIS